MFITKEHLDEMIGVCKNNWTGMTKTEKINSIRFIIVDLSDANFYNSITQDESSEVLSEVNKLMLKLTELGQEEA